MTLPGPFRKRGHLRRGAFLTYTLIVSASTERVPISSALQNGEEDFQR
jgi:hypothetical protein